jgi:phenylpropionate dioxygenase-like ring-hydroxylating dioxygenase large terminal subunit
MFACPYHRWCYTRTGAIRSIPFDDGFDDGFTAAARANLRLAEHPSILAGNLVWAVPDRNAVPAVAGPRLDRTVIGFWFLAAPGSDPGEEAGLRGDERIARLRAVWS